MQEYRVRSLGQGDPLKKGMATHSSIIVWRTSWTGEPGWLQSMGSQRVRHDWVTNILSWCSSRCFLECSKFIQAAWPQWLLCICRGSLALEGRQKDLLLPEPGGPSWNGSVSPSCLPPGPKLSPASCGCSLPQGQALPNRPWSLVSAAQALHCRYLDFDGSGFFLSEHVL